MPKKRFWDPSFEESFMVSFPMFSLAERVKKKNNLGKNLTFPSLPIDTTTIPIHLKRG